MKKSVPFLTGLIPVILLMLSGCNLLTGAQDQIISITRHFPSRITLDVPASLQHGSAVSGLSARTTGSISINSNQENPAGLQVTELRDAMGLMEALRNGVALQFIIADRMIDDAFVLGTESREETYRFTISQDVLDAIDQLSSQPAESANQTPMSQGQGESHLPNVGEELLIDFDYEPIESNGSGLYAHRLTLKDIRPASGNTFSESSNEVSFPETELFWSADNNAIAIVTDLSASTNGQDDDSYIAYFIDDESGTAAFKFLDSLQVEVSQVSSNGDSQTIDFTIIVQEAEPRLQNALYIIWQLDTIGVEGYANDTGGVVRSIAEGDSDGDSDKDIGLVFFDEDANLRQETSEIFSNRLERAPFSDMQQNTSERWTMILPGENNDDD
jgi:hypothetical protein